MYIRNLKKKLRVHIVLIKRKCFISAIERNNIEYLNLKPLKTNQLLIIHIIKV